MKTLASPAHAFRFPLLVLLLSAVALIAPHAAHADEAYALRGTFACDPAYWGAGQSDENGTTYIACGTKIVRFDRAGTRLADIAYATGTQDVAPSPNGDVLYVNYNGRIRRLVRNAQGGYGFDANWKPQNFQSIGQTWEPKAWMMATDASGDLYLSNGGWAPGEPNVILKYGPDGVLKTQFGTWGNGAGEFNTNFGITVTRDGRSVYVAEQTNSRIQRFDYNGGQYHYVATIGTKNENCDVLGQFAAPYDLGVDPWGYLYVADTTCYRIQKISPHGQPLGAVAAVPLTAKRSHGIAVTHRGEFMVGQWGSHHMRAATNPVPGPVPAIAPLPAADNVAPVIEDMFIPETSCYQQIAITLSVRDAASQIRIANESGAWSQWLPWDNPMNYKLSDGYLYKLVTVQVRDEAGNESNVLTRRTQYVECHPPAADTQAPWITYVDVPAVTTTRTVDVRVGGADDTGLAGVRFANEDGVWGPWKDVAAGEFTMQHTLSDGYRIKSIATQVRDAAGNESAVAYRTLEYRAAVGVDWGDPVLVNASIPAETDSRDITVSLEATDDIKVTRVRLANEDGNWGAWQPFQPQKAWQLSANYGPKLVFVQVGDAAWNESKILQLRTRYRADAPLPDAAPDAVNPVLSALDVPATSTTQTISVGLTATDNTAVAQVRFANEDGEWGAWRAYAPKLDWTLSAGYTYKLVFAQVRDAAGNESGVLMKRTQWVLQAPVQQGPVDAADPVLESIVVPNPATTQTIPVEVHASDDVGVHQVRFANEDGNWGAWQAHASLKQWTLSPGNNLYKLVFAQVRDASGRESNVVMVRTILQM